MQEVTFLKRGRKFWQETEQKLNSREELNPEELGSLYLRISDDLSYANTFYPGSRTADFLNSLAQRLHIKVYKNKKEDSDRFFRFWKTELPLIMYSTRKQLLYSLLLFIVSITIGALSAAYDLDFVRIILGDQYVDMTINNINTGDPLAVYKQANEMTMFLGITINNIYVSMLAFTMGIFLSIGTGYVMFQNGVMLGSFQYFFYDYGLLYKSFLVIYIHGTIELSAIIIAGAAGLTLGSSILFPGTFTRMESLKRGAKKGLKIVTGLIPFFIIAGFLEGFVTRYTEMPEYLSLPIITASFLLVIWYFVLYPIKIYKKTGDVNGGV